MPDRRRLARFELRLPAALSWVDENQKERTRSLFTKDVSAGGAFLYSTEPLPPGTSVRLLLALTNEKLRALTGTQGSIRVEGEVLRAQTDGMAVRFSKTAWLSPKASNTSGPD
jgi:hypothetical protein